MPHPAPRAGFSLLELSIVLVIIGLLSGGILGGTSLIKAAEIRSIGTDAQRYMGAINAFRDKYFTIPGDMSNAQQFWGVAATCPGISTTVATGVCNGDGNGTILANATASNELFGFWEHLAMAGMVEGSFTGNSGDTTAANPTAIPGTNVARSRISNAGFTAFGVGTIPVTDANWFEGNYGNALIFGGTQTANVTDARILKPEEAWNIDTKLDDGRPATGIVVTPEKYGSSTLTTACTNLDTANTSLSASQYQLSLSSANCSLAIKTGI